jgi:hypothetical protein
MGVGEFYLRLAVALACLILALKSDQERGRNDRS